MPGGALADRRNKGSHRGDIHSKESNPFRGAIQPNVRAIPTNGGL